MVKTASIIDRLNDALESRVLIELCRDDLETGRDLGYVIGIGPVFFLLAIVAPHIRFDGFQAFRMSDLTELTIPHTYSTFVERALALRKESQPDDPNIDLSSLPTLIQTASKCATLITIHREEIDPDICQIGKVVEVTDTKLVLKEIDPDACWHEETDEYDLFEITRIDFGSEYENALAMVNNAE